VVKVVGRSQSQSEKASLFENIDPDLIYTPLTIMFPPSIKTRFR